MPRVAATAASAARSAPVRSPDPLSAHAVWIQTPKATTGARPARGGSAPRGHRLALGEPAQPDHRHQLGVGHLRQILSSGSVTSEATSSSRAAARAGGFTLGSQAGEAAIREVTAQAGFSRFRRATQTPFNAVYEARP